ncbi:MAG TPA: cytochrome o ubiquinol oxidase subunit IV [Williamwhitmania sp.]|nr:cytochrome o ubiquinol oxidase subunit IV [Williamwhitmania sp.]
MSQTHNEEMGASHATAKTYIIGLILAVTLTVVSFALVMSHAVSRPVAMGGLFLAAMLQMLVHLYYFLHLNRSSAARWNVIALAFTALLLFIFIGGTLWVMYTLNSRMM